MDEYNPETKYKFKLDKMKNGSEYLEAFVSLMMNSGKIVLVLMAIISAIFFGKFELIKYMFPVPWKKDDLVKKSFAIGATTG